MGKEEEETKTVDTLMRKKLRMEKLKEIFKRDLSNEEFGTRVVLGFIC